MAPPCGKFWFILFMSSEKQLKAMASEERKEGGSQSEWAAFVNTAKKIYRFLRKRGMTHRHRE